MDNKILATIIAIFVGITLVGSVLMPTVIDASEVLGDPVTYTNENGGTGFREAKAGDVLSITREVGAPTDLVMLNGETVTRPNSWDNLIMSDGIYSRTSPTSYDTIFRYYDINSENPIGTIYVNMPGGSTTYTYTFTFSGSEIVMSDSVDGGAPTVRRNIEYSWAYIPCPDSEKAYNFVSVDGASSTIYVKNGTIPILCGAYETGDVDGIYWLYDGETFFSTADYEIEPTFTYSLADGTTDIYTLGVTVDVEPSAESFVPYKVLVPTVVDGHKDSGAAYSIVSVLPVMVIVGILAGVVAVLFRSRY